jgi:hypothetical protein
MSGSGKTQLRVAAFGKHTRAGYTRPARVRSYMSISYQV